METINDRMLTRLFDCLVYLISFILQISDKNYILINQFLQKSTNMILLATLILVQFDTLTMIYKQSETFLKHVLKMLEV